MCEISWRPDTSGVASCSIRSRSTIMHLFFRFHDVLAGQLFWLDRSNFFETEIATAHPNEAVSRHCAAACGGADEVASCCRGGSAEVDTILSMMLDEAEAEAEEDHALPRYGRTNTIQYHETMAEQFAIFFATRGDNCTGIIDAGDVRDVRPVGMTISISWLRSWHFDLRRGDGVFGRDQLVWSLVDRI